MSTRFNEKCKEVYSGIANERTYGATTYRPKKPKKKKFNGKFGLDLFDPKGDDEDGALAWVDTDYEYDGKTMTVSGLKLIDNVEFLGKSYRKGIAFPKDLLKYLDLPGRKQDNIKNMKDLYQYVADELMTGFWSHLIVPVNA